MAPLNIRTLAGDVAPEMPKGKRDGLPSANAICGSIDPGSPKRRSSQANFELPIGYHHRLAARLSEKW
jgi:hypothetical protein